jgi:hypothetical protein
MQASDPHPHLTIFFGIWAAIGPLGGIGIGHYLTTSWQNKRWLLDRRREEFKEVATAITRVVIEHLVHVASEGSPLPQSKQDYLDLMKAAYVVLIDRIYIEPDLDKANIGDRFLKIMDQLRESGEDFDKPADEMTKLLKEVVAMARKG